MKHRAHKFFGWRDKRYCSFMINLLRLLEPRQFQAEEIIYRDLEEVDEILFVTKGEYTIGYSVNNQEKEKQALKMHDRTVIGDISLMFRRRSEFFYRAFTTLHCQAIRKHNYYEIMEKYNEYNMKIKVKAFNRYKDLIRRPVLEHKRATYELIYRLHPNERFRNHVVVDDSAADDLILLNEMKDDMI